MGKLVVDRGLQLIGDRASSVAGAGLAIQTMAIDDGTVAFVAGATTLGSPATEADAALATPTRSSQTVSHVGTFLAGVGTMTIKRISLHNDTPANVTGASTTLIAGVDAQSLLKDASLDLVITLKITYTSV